MPTAALAVASSRRDRAILEGFSDFGRKSTAQRWFFVSAPCRRDEPGPQPARPPPRAVPKV